ncbi:MAG: GGDEF domain-containing protein [Nevskia sp.]|nr:GGDEF domain-containing protein [Nevskia sp.]
MAPTPENPIRELINRRAVSVVFQPIADLPAGRIYGYEAAIRGPADGPLHNPSTLFLSALQANLLLPLECLCIEVHCRRFVELDLPGKLFLNVSPPSLIDPEFRARLRDTVARSGAIGPERVVIEITEQYPLDDYEGIRAAAAEMREYGYRIALDDLGAGYAGLRIWSELKPDFVKIDRHFVENIHEDTVKQDFVRSIMDIGRGLNCSAVAEGIETTEELAALCRLGIGLGQGFLLGMPRPAPILSLPSSAAIAQSETPARAGLKLTAGDLVRPAPTVPPDRHAEQVVDQFRADRTLLAIPVVENGAPLGLVQRQELLDLFSARYARELHGRRAIGNFVNAQSIAVEEATPLDEVSRLITEHPEQELTHTFLVTRSGRYLGVGKTLALLRRITEQQIVTARYSNPLTLLPGGVPLCEHVDSLLAGREDFRMAYFDLNFFKPYNDVYGYASGDMVIRMLGEILRRHADTRLDFLGHIGGDDFVLVLRSPDWSARCQKIIADFAAGIRGYYPEDALRAGGIVSEDRRGNAQHFPLLSLAVGIVHPDPAFCRSHNEVSALAAEAKHEAKKVGGNSIFVSRRRQPAEAVAGDSREPRAAAG